MLLTNWLKTLTSRLRRRTVVRSRDRRALRRYWQTALNNQISTVEVLEDRTLLTTITGTTPDGTGAEEDHPVNQYGAEAHWIPINYSEAEAAPVTGGAPPFSVSDTFNLSSLAGANHTIYLDFNGHTTTGTYWNEYYASGSSIVTPAYDTDGNVAVFSTAEHEAMQRVWQRIAEDFAPFNVNVTTVEPPISDLIKSNTADTRWGVRIVIGENTFYHAAGGVAFLESFNWNSDTPAFVFNTEMSEVALAITHEVGHTLGLTHDGTPTQEYYRGHGSGVTSWAPIMGSGYNRNLIQWSKGEYTDANNNQDDLSIITTQNGFDYRADDHGSSIIYASTVTDGMASGIVERNTDVDYFQFTTNGGDVHIDPFIEDPNLDILARLYDSGGAQIQTSNPVGALNASFTGLSAGTYYVSIEGTGEGSVSGTGYSDYGSLGQYTVTFSAQVPTLDVISDITLTENATLQTVNLSGITAGLGESQPLRVTASSSHTGLIRDPLVSYTSPDGTGTLTFTPVAHQRGTATITVTVEDGGLDGDLDTPNDNVMFSRTFDVTVNAVNGVPTIFSQGELLPDPAANPAAGDETGSAVAVDGDWMVVAAEYYDNRDGIVYLYVRNDVNQTPDNLTDDAWDFHSTIYAPTNGVEPGYYFFGKSVAIDGNTLIIGASYADDGDLAGSVYLYQLNEGTEPGHEDDVWVHQRTFTQPADGLFGDPFPRGFGPSVSNFGHSLAIQGQTIVVGAPNADVDETTKRAGAVYVFMTDDSWNTYSTSKLTASDATDYAYFGESVAISEDENTIIAGDPYHSSGDPPGYLDGAVYLFSRDTSGTTSPVDDSWSEFKMLTAVETDSQFGTSVGIENGIAVIGSNGDAYVIQESENWDVLTSLAGFGETKPVRFGLGVAISGDVILVGGPDFTDPADPGAIYLFDGWNGWEAPDLEKLYALDPNLNETFFTESIAISGGTIIAGWHNHAHDGVQTGVAYAYEYQPVIDLQADLIDGSLVINNLTNENASVSLSVSDGALVVTHPDNRLVPPVEGNQVSLTQFTIPLSALISGEIYINGGAGDDRVSVDTSLAAAGLKVIFTGGEGVGFDSLEVTGTASSAEYLFENEHDGKVQLNNSGLDLISYTGLEPITSSIDAAQVTLIYSDVDETISVSSPASGQLSVDSTAGEIIFFQDFTGKLTLDAGAGINTLNLNDLGTSLTADFEILDSAGTETVILVDTLNLGSGKISIAAETVQIAGAVTGTGDVEIAATAIEFANANSLLNTGAGNIELISMDDLLVANLATTGNVSLTSLNGDIRRVNSSEESTVSAYSVVLSAENGAIGSGALYPLLTEVSYLEAVAYGEINLENTGDLIIGGASDLVGVEGLGGESVQIFTNGSLQVSEDVVSPKQLFLKTSDSDDPSADRNLIVDSGVVLQSTTQMFIWSCDDLLIEQDSLLMAFAISLTVDSSGGNDVDGGRLDLLGQLAVSNGPYAYVEGGAQADSFYISPSLNNSILLQAFGPSSPGDSLYYYNPEGVTATQITSSTNTGTVTFSNGYQDIVHISVENVQGAGAAPQSDPARLMIAGTSGDDVLTVNTVDADSGTWQLNDGPVVNFDGIESFSFFGLAGDDRLVINNPVDGVFHPPGGINFIGGTGGETWGDTLEIIGGFVADSEFEFITQNRGRVFYGDLVAPAINYFDLEEVYSELSVTNQRLYYSYPDAQSLSISDAGAGVTAFDAANGAPLRLMAPIERLAFQYGNNSLKDYQIDLNSIGTGFTGELIINDHDDNLMVILTDGLNLGSGDVTIDAETVQIAGAVSGSGDLGISATTIEFLNTNSSLNTGDGDLSLLASNTIDLGQVISTGSVEITSLNGDINDNNDSVNNITAARAILSAVNGFIGYTLDTVLGNLEAVAFGNIDITNTGDLIIGGISELEGIESTYSRVFVRSYGGMQVTENVFSYTSLLLSTQDSEIASLDEDILVHSGVTLHSDMSWVALYSDDDLTIEEQVTLETLSSNIYLRVNDQSADGIGGVLKLSGNLITQEPTYRALVYGSEQADTFWIAPSLNSQMTVNARLPATPDLIGDTLNYLLPDGETVTSIPSSDANGTLTFSGGYQNISYNNVETLQQGDLSQLAGQLRIDGTAGDDVLTINATDANSGTWQLNGGPAVAFSAIDELAFYGLTGDDRLVINNPAGMIFNPVGGILYDAGGQVDDELKLTGGFATSEEHRLVAGQHAVYFNGSAEATIRHLGVSRVLSELDTAETTLTGDSLTVSSNDGIQTSVTGDGTSINFASLTGALSLQGDTDTTTIQLNALGSGLTGALNFGGGKQEVLIFNDGLDLGDRDFTLQVGTVQVAGAVTRTGNLEIEAPTIEFTNPDSSLNTGDGDLSLQAENSINLGEVISTGTVTITSLNGAIFDYNEDSNNITASRAILSAVNGAIGNTSIIEAGGASTNSLETTIEYLEAIADGIIDITNSGDLIIGGIGTLNGIESIHERVVVSAYGSIEVREDITAYAQLLLRTKESALDSLNEDILIQSGVTLHSETIYVGLYSDDDLTIEEQALLQAPANHIYLRVNYNSSDRVGGVLRLTGIVETPEPNYRTYVYGSSFADSFLIAPSLNSLITVIANSPASPDLIGDTLNYLLPDGETATLTPSNDSDGIVSFTGAYSDITYTGIENLQQGDLSQLAGQLRIDGTAANDVLTINATDENSGTWQLNSGPEVVFSDINELVFYGLTGDDRLVINHPDGAIFNPTGGILYDGGGQAGDELELTGGTLQSVQHRLDEGQNAIYFNGSVDPIVRYLGVGTVIADTDAVATTVVGDSLTVSSDDGVQTRVTGNTGVLFTSYSGFLAVEGTSASATIQLNSLGSGVSGTLLIGGNQQETVILNDGLDLGSADLTIHAGSAQVTGAVTRAGDIQIEANTITFADANSGIDAGAGNIELTASEDLIVANLTTTGTIFLTSLNGDIHKGTIGAALIKAFSAVLSAEKGNITDFGSSSELFTEISHLEVIAYEGVRIRNTGDLTIGGVSDLVGIEVSGSGSVMITNTGSLQFSEDVISVMWQSFTTLDVNDPSANSNLIVDSGVLLQSAETIHLVSCDDLLIEQNALLTASDIRLFVDAGGSNDLSGGRLDLLGELAGFWNSQVRIYGGTQADSFYIKPSLSNPILVDAHDPTSPGDMLYFYTPEGVTATLSNSSTTVGTVSFSDGYQDILHFDVETVENAGTPPEPDPGWISVAGTSGNDVLTVNATDSNSGTWQLNAGPVVSFDDIESFTFFGLEGDDRLVINNPVDGVFQPAGGINYGGGSGGETLGDTLEIIGGVIEDSEFEFVANNRGRIFYGNGAAPAINHFNLEELSSELSVTNQQIYYSFPGTQPLTISEAGAGVTAFDCVFGTPLKLISPIETLTLQFGNHPLNDYQINLNSLGAGFSADLIFNDRDDNTSITLGDGLHLGSGAVSINAETVQVAGAVSGAGDLDIVATTIDFPNTNSSLNTGDGNLRLQSENSINLGEVISTGNVEITSLTGDITDNNDSANNIAASRAILSTINGRIGYTLETEVGNLEAVASGDIDITNTGDLIIGGVSELEGIESTNGRVIVRSFGGIEVQENVSSYTNLLLWTQDSAVASLDEDILVHSGVTLKSETNYVGLYSDDDVTVQEQALLQTSAHHIYFQINYDSADGVGGVLDLDGKLITEGPSYRTLVYGSSQADSYQIAPSLDSRIFIQGYHWSQTETLDDELIYYIPQGEVATHNISGPDQGQISFSGSYQDIGYNNVHTHFLAGSLTLEGTAGDDVLTINATGANSGTFQFNEGPVVAFTDLTDLTFRGLEGDDRLVINHPSEGLFAPLGGVLFEGGGQTTEDTLEIYGGTASSVEHRFINENDGSIIYNGQTTAAITYTGLEPVLDTIAATDRSFSFTGSAETITLSDEGDAGDGESMIDSTLGESVVFTHPTGMLTINTEVFGGTGSDTIIVNSVDSTFTANLTINTGNDDTVTLNTIDSGSGNVELNANEVNIDGTLTTSGMVAIQADSLIRFAETGVIDATANTVQLTAGLSILLGKIITAGDVWLTSTGGAILDATISESSLVQSNSLFLQAATGIGGAGDADLDIEANQIIADSYQGPLMLDNFGGLFLQLAELPDLVLNEDAGEQTIPLSLITTAGGTSQPLSVTATSSQPSLIPNPQINYLAGDTTDSLVFTPASEQNGTATITLLVTDGGADHLLETTGDNRSIELTFDITVSPQNDDPELDPLGDLLVSANAPEQTVLFSGITAGGGEVQPLRVTAESNNPGLIADPVVNYASADSTGSLSFTPVADQTGTATITVIVEDGGLDGDLETTADNATLTRTFVVTVSVLETVSLRVMDDPTATDANGETESLSAEVNWLGEWDSYWLELWVSTEDLNSQGITSVSLDLAYLTDLTSATGIEYGAAFSQNQSGTINDENGLVEGLSATTDLTDLGINTQLLFARIRFESLAEDNVLLDLEGQRIGPHDPGFQIQTLQIGLASERVSQNAIEDHTAAAIWANPFDLNDDGQISFRDLLLFASVYNSFTAESSSQYAWFSDFNQSGRVAFRDLVLLATNYNKSKLLQQQVIYPNNYPQDWDQQLQVSSLLDTPSTARELNQNQAQTALQSAVDDVRPKLSDEGQQKLAQVQVEVVDLSGNTLGRVEGNTIYLDVNAAGYGWFVDQTPRDHSEFYSDGQLSLIALPDSEAAGLIDLWTVIRHELGHLLGYEHTDDGLMEAVLDPGERKLADWSEETDDFFASLEDDTELLSF
ncbi:hypothetical protein FYZ48_25390 [Gimesia chilikensis]|uniref:hypothetical protein n=1 Tax=Gimesia chilikensis TaxID=2605989 RepID=UPI0011EBA949|nr:hypothetical protein [Gimesia chilikensis]KAA0131483.1 hypothetical protein FYZ48_25390 [Gimesia chilikensis]